MSSSRRSRSKAGSAADNGSTSRAQSRNAAKEARRIRGEIACAECRRLKIRCDRKVPCSTCVARGCAILCPNDVLPPGDNSRHVDFATDHLQQKITKMEARMRLLEDALEVAQMQDSPEPHPLLRTPFLLDDEELDDGEVAKPEDELVEVMGSLHINEKDGSVQFYGPTGGGESLLRHEGNQKRLKSVAVQDSNAPMALRALGLPQEFDVFFLSFPFTPMGIPRSPVRLTIETLLPPRSRAEELVEIFMENLSWMFQIVTLSYLKTELVPMVYRRAAGDLRRAEDYCPHDLALMLIVLAIGALVDLTQRPYNAEAHRYAAMARTAAALQPLMEDISLATVKFTHLLSIYNGMCGKESAISSTYALTNVASVMAQKIGLHMDPSVWNLDEKMCYERRSYFWSLLQADIWMCLSSGRPPAISNSGAHCRVPTEEDYLKFRKGEKIEGFGIWGAMHARDCLIPLSRHINSTTPPTYQSVLDLEKKLVAHFVPNSDALGPSDSVATSMRGWVRSHYHELILLFLHRAFFAKAIATHPDNPLNSPYAYSFRTAYHCACVVMRTIIYQYTLYPDLMSRIWQIWTFAFTSAVIIGAVATRTQELDLDPPPLKMFDEICEVFRAASTISPRAAKGLPVLISLQEKAHRLRNRKGKEPMRPGSASSSTIGPGPTHLDDDIAVFAGKTRIVAQSVASPSPYAVLSHLPPVSYHTGRQPFALASGYPPQGPPHSMPPHHLHHPSRPATSSYNMHSAPVPSPSFPLGSHDHPQPSGSQPPTWSRQSHGLDLHHAGPTASDPAYYHFQHEGAGPVDFILDDSWSSFLQNYAGIPPPG